MKTLILELPGVFDKHLSDVFRASLKQLKLPSLSRLVSKADKYSISDFKGSQYSALEATGKINPQFAANYLNLEKEQANPYQYWFRADPVELLTDISTIHLKGNRHFKFSEQQIKQLEKQINQCIEEHHGKYYMVSETEGYFGCNQAAEVSFVSLLNALGNDQREMAAKGIDANYWIQLQTEIQMGLFGTTGPQNSTNKKLPVNSLHFWGNAQAKPLQKQVERVVSDSNLILGVAKASNISIKKYSEFDAGFNFENSDSLQLVPMDLLWSQKYADIETWNRILMSIENRWMGAISSALKTRKLEEIYLLMGGEYFYCLKYSNLKKFWRRKKTLYDFIEG